MVQLSIWLAPTLAEIERSALGDMVRATPQLYPLLESLHILGIALLVGSALAVDLRLTGLGARTLQVTTVTRHLLPLSRLGFGIAAASGLAMFAGIAVSIGQSAAAPWKLGLILLAGLNIAVFHGGVYRSIEQWDTCPAPPNRVRIAGAVSAFCWIGVIIAGRFLAYV